MRIEGFVIATWYNDDGAAEETKNLDIRVSCPDAPTAGDVATVELAWHGRLDKTRMPPITFAPDELRRAFKRLNLPRRGLPPAVGRSDANPDPIRPARTGTAAAPHDLPLGVD